MFGKRNHLTAIAPRGSKAGLTSLKHSDSDTLLKQRERRGQPCEPRTYDRDLGIK